MEKGVLGGGSHECKDRGVIVHVLNRKQFSIARPQHGNGTVTRDEIDEPSKVRSPRVFLPY